MGEMGWMGLVIPEKCGGADGSFLDLVVLLEEMGRACLPGPFFSTVVLGGLTLIETGSVELAQTILPKLAEGKLLLTLAFLEPNSGYSPEGINMKAVKKGDKFIVQGSKIFVTDAHVADYIICAVRTNDIGKPEHGITLLLIDVKSPGISINMLKSLSGDKQCEVVFDSVEVSASSIIGIVDEGWSALEKILEKVTVARCAEMVGAAKYLLEITVDYTKQRKAFGHPIGSFQTIQHYLANMLVVTDGCAMMVYNTAWRLSEGLPAEQEVSMTKAITNESLKRVATLAFQSHGAIAFTEDHDIPLYYKRTKAWEPNMGSTQFHLEKLAKSAGIN